MGNYAHLSKAELAELQGAAKVYVRLAIKADDPQSFDMTWSELVEAEDTEGVL
jgi:hypothetical protein